MRVTKISSAAVLLALACGCSHMAWEKPGGTTVSARADLDACYRSFREQAPPQFSPNRNSAFTNAVSDAQSESQAAAQFANGGYARDLAAAQNFASRCMQDQGYALVPSGGGMR